MASGDVYAAVRAYLAANWVATPLVYDNEEYDPPADQHWCMVEMVGTMYGRTSFGTDDAFSDRWEEQGMLIFTVMAPAGAGTGTARTHLKNLADLFRGAALMNGNMVFEDAAIGLGERALDANGAMGNWFRLPMTQEWRIMDR